MDNAIKRIIALDFDGVICDSVRELAIAGYKSARTFWPEQFIDAPSERYLKEFQQLRPVIETGYESLLLAYLIVTGVDHHRIQSEFQDLSTELAQAIHLTRDEGIRRFGSVRDEWIANDIATWIAAHSFYPGIVPAIAQFMKRGTDVVIITTKEKRFADILLRSAGATVRTRNIYGLLEGPKVDILRRLSTQPVGGPPIIDFIEDRLPTLQMVCEDTALTSIQLHLAAWGYNTPEQRRIVLEHERINLLPLDQFPCLVL